MGSWTDPGAANAITVANLRTGTPLGGPVPRASTEPVTANPMDRAAFAHPGSDQALSNSADAAMWTQAPTVAARWRLSLRNGPTRFGFGWFT